MTQAEPLQQFLTLLGGAALDFDGEMVADALWLAQHVTVEEEDAGAEVVSVASGREQQRDGRPDFQPEDRRREPEPEPPAVDVVPRESERQRTDDGLGGATGQPFQAAAAKALRNERALARALKLLKRRVRSAREQVLDEDATASLTAERQFCVPVMGPAPERWLEVALVVEEAPSTFLWERTIREFQALLERQGSFRDVRVWSLRPSQDANAGDGKPGFQLFAQRSGSGQKQDQGRPRSPKELVDPAGRRVILLVSDCTSGLWRSGAILPLLKAWGKEGLFSILQLLPERLWSRTALSFGGLARLSALAAGVPNEKLRAELLVWMEEEKEILQIPVVTLEKEALQQWAGVLAGVGHSRTAGVLVGVEAFLESVAALGLGETPKPEEDLTEAEALQRVRQFQLGASSGLVSRLAGYMAAVPVSPPITDLIRETLLPGATQAHVAEVYMSGLMRREATDQAGLPRYAFIPAVRWVLVRTVLASRTEVVLDAVTRYLVQRLELSVPSFVALLRLLQTEDSGAALDDEVRAFARFGTETLRQMGGRYAEWVETFVDSPGGGAEGDPEVDGDWPPLEDFEFPVAKIVFDDDEPSQAEAENTDELEEFEFETVRVDRRGEIIHREQLWAWQFVEELGAGVGLEMVAVPGGTFVMGEGDGRHEVTVPDFFVGKYSVTQAQWRVVAAMPLVERELDAEPSNFKGDNRPVEQVSWYDAQEFCARLSRATGRTYRLPSEAEWEYACRAETETPFYFGEKLTSELANFNGDRNGTTDVGSYPANAFGLFDMHGNVYDWCEDHFHNSYKGAPSDGSAWVELDEGASERSRLLRGGSWLSNPWDCRSAYRNFNSPGLRFINYGFRVVCVSARTP